MTVHHIVMYTFKPEVIPEQRQNVGGYGKALPSQIPAIQSLVKRCSTPSHMAMKKESFLYLRALPS
ncbi:hypothetical protein BDR07DRAFT_1414359 [Suillus spraguei]|nr:hypothetical protein BDR07DRAFT_1414359 [Suillus spraguei]